MVNKVRPTGAVWINSPAEFGVVSDYVGVFAVSDRNMRNVPVRDRFYPSVVREYGQLFCVAWLKMPGTEFLLTTILFLLVKQY